MNIRTKLILSVGVLAGMIILLVALSVVNLQDFCDRWGMYFCQYHIVGMASPFHQQTYSRTDAWDS